MKFFQTFFNEEQSSEQMGGEDDISDIFSDENKSPDDESNSSQSTDNIDDILSTDGEENTSSDPDKQGLIRTVKSAHLVYKREVGDGTFEELWMYNVSKLQHELDIRKAILAGTDIPVSKTESPDGKQSYDLWSAGNAELLHIKGLQN